MRRLAVLLFAAASTASATSLAAQAGSASHPDFSGKWTLDVSKLEGPMAQAGITSATLTITQDATVMKQDQAMSSGMGSTTASLTYNLDGSDSKNTITQGPMSLALTSTASWDGSTLVINTKGDMQGQPYSRTDRYTLDATGKVLTIETKVSVMGQSLPIKQVFNKA